MKRQKKRPLKKIVLDPVYCGALALLVFFGLFMVASSSLPTAVKDLKNPLYFFYRHLIFVILGLLASLVVMRIPLKLIRRLSLMFFLISLGMMMLLFTDYGVNIWGQVRWLRIPGTGILFMPADFLKLSSILFTAHVLTVGRKFSRKVVFGVMVVILGLSVAAIAIRDFSTAAVHGITLVAMYFAAGMGVQEGIIIFGGAALGARLLVTMDKFAYRLQRIMTFLDPFDDIQDTDWQLAHSLYALGIGGLFGQGPLRSRLKAGYLPLPYNDFIFAIIGEEWGLIGCLFVIALYVILTWRGFYLVTQTKSPYARLVAVGIVTSVAVQAFFNMGVSAGILPVTGLPLPFVSYGGTTMVVSFAAVGILFGIMSRKGE